MSLQVFIHFSGEQESQSYLTLRLGVSHFFIGMSQKDVWGRWLSWNVYQKNLLLNNLIMDFLEQEKTPQITNPMWSMICMLLVVPVADCLNDGNCHHGNIVPGIISLG